ncbi:MAG: hypothetical protein J2P30_01660 [Actinobacteria bacterium]|nr:hypothetical protein [Actinomycetota bacterium]
MSQDWLDGLIKRVRDHDAAKPRSVQQAVGWSELGGCRAALGYRLDGAWPSDETDNWAAVRGTALHEYLEPVLAADGVRTEVDTIYRGVPGHADLVGERWVADLKTKTLASSRVWQGDPATMKQARIQVHGYAAGLVDAGELPEDCTVRILVVPIDGTFSDWWCYEEPFDRSLADEGIERLDEVRRLLAEGAPLPKDKPWSWCSKWCPFVSLCRTPGDDAGEPITDPDIAAAVAAYGQMSESISALERDRKKLAPMLAGLNGTAGDWRVSMSAEGKPKPVPDEDAIRAAYEARGEEMPVVLKPGRAAFLRVTRTGGKP